MGTFRQKHEPPRLLSAGDWDAPAHRPCQPTLEPFWGVDGPQRSGRLVGSSPQPVLEIYDNNQDPRLPKARVQGELNFRNHGNPLGTAKAWTMESKRRNGSAREAEKVQEKIVQSAHGLGLQDGLHALRLLHQNLVHSSAIAVLPAHCLV